MTETQSSEGGPAFITNDTLAFFTDRDGDVEIYTMDLHTKAAFRLTNTPGYDGVLDVWVPAHDGTSSR